MTDRLALDNGLTLIRCHVPGRPLLQAQLIIGGDAGGGATSEAAVDQARQRADELCEIAVAALNPLGKPAEILQELARYIVTRNN